MTHENDKPRPGDENVERLIEHSYRPDAPDPEFVARVEERLLAAARQMRTEPERPAGRLHVLPRIVAGVAAAALVCAVAWLGSHVDGSLPQSTVTAEEVATALQQFPRPGVGPGGLAPREAALAPDPVLVATGDVLRTGASERRRVTLSDGSVLFVDADSDVVIEDARCVRVESGSVYVEVHPNPKHTFRVLTPTRELTALGTRFAVDVDDGATTLLVTHGLVAAGLDRAVRTGERMVERDGRAVIEPSERTSHAIDWTRDLVAAAASPLVPSSDYEGGALIAMDPWGQESRLSLRKYHVDVHIEDGFARTTIDQTYFNHAQWRMEGTFYFPLPADASLSRLAMYVADRRMEGGMTERNRARDVYEQIVHRRKDPALLEWVDGTTFKMRVFPLEAREEKRVLLSYTQRLPAHYGATTYRFPAGRDLGIVGDWSFNAHVVGIDDWRSDSHSLTGISNQLGTVELAAQQKGVLMEDDVVLRLRGLDSPKPGATSFRTAEHDGFRYLMVRHRPDVAARAAPERRDWIFLVETSGSRDPIVARAQIEIVREMLALAEADDRFALVTAATRTSKLSDKLLVVTPENVAAAMEMLESSHLIGALDLRRALGATRPFAADAENPVVVHVGTGVSTVGERDPGTLAKVIPEGTEYVGVAIGRQWSRPFMKQAAARSGGLYTQIDPTETLAWRAFDLKATLDTSRVLDVKVVDDAESAAFLGFEDSAAHGDEIVAVTRVAMDAELPSTVTLAGRLDGRAWSRTVSVADVKDEAGYLPRQWAKLEIDRLLADDAKAHKDAIVALSKAMYVMSPYTSLLVLENEKMYEQFGVDRGRSDHWALYPAPDTIEVVREPLDGPKPHAPEGAVDPQEILGTILVRAAPYLVVPPNGQQSWRYSYGGGTYTVRDRMQFVRSQGWASYAFDYETETYSDAELGDIDGDGRFQVLDAVQSLRESMSGRASFDQFGRIGGGWRQAWGRPGLPSGGGFYYYGIGGGAGGGHASAPFSFGMSVFDASNIRSASALQIDSLSRVFENRVDRDGLVPLARMDRRLSVLFSTRDEPIVDDALRINFLQAGGEFEERLSTASFESAGSMPISGFTGLRVQLQSESGGPQPMDLPGLVVDGYRRSVGQSGATYRASEAALSMGMLARIQQGTLYQRLQYQRPWVNNDHRFFGDLLALAPGMNTTTADIAAVLAAESGRAVQRGTVDADAARLIARARSAGWREIRDDTRGFVLTFDGAGRFRMERTLPSGLREIVVCDGDTLRHLYPEIGVGAVRQMSREYRGSLSAAAPWLLPPAEDLAIGANVRSVDANTIELVPINGGAFRVRLTFADGLLVKRQILKDDAELVGIDFKHSADGVETGMRVDTETEESVGVTDVVAPVVSAAPDLVADDSELVVLPLPYRTRQHNWTALGVDKNGLPMEEWSEDDSLAMLASDFGTNWQQAEQTVDRRFLAQGDQRLGFYTILLAGGYRWDPGKIARYGDVEVRPDPRLAHPQSQLAHYVAACADRDNNSGLELPEGFDDGFLGQMSRTANEITRWTSGRGGNNSDYSASRKRTLEVAATVDNPHLRWALLCTFLTYSGLEAETAPRLAELLEPLTQMPEYAYYARYDRATALANAGTDEARAESLEEFLALHEAALEHGILPGVDGHFLGSLRGRDDERWREHWRAAARTLIERGARSAVPYVGLQLQWVGDQVLGDELIGLALEDCPDEQRLATTLATVEVLWQQGHMRRAEALLEPLLAQEEYANSASLWRLGAYLADAQGAVARGVLRQERALELAFDDLPEIVDLSIVRQEYGMLLARFEQLANAVEALGGDVPDEVISRVVRTADRWRALDDDPTAACHAAARILRTLDAEDLAWDYLTTPLGARPNEGAPWAQLAAQLQQGGDVDLADRCYAAAWEIEPTNAQFLWDRAEMLRSAGRKSEAREVWRTLANGEWQPRFQWIRDQARQRLGR